MKIPLRACQRFMVAPVKRNRLLDSQVSGKWQPKTYARWACLDAVGSWETSILEGKKIGWRCKDLDSEVHLEGSMVHMIYVPNDTEHHTVRIITEGDN
jgi:hypothetical protein